jgi:tripartite-type tricarboxylate transporter receptor subunit TctC
MPGLRCIAVALSLLTAGPAAAQDGQNFFAGRELTMLATSPPGGGYDWYARTVSRYMSK